MPARARAQEFWSPGVVVNCCLIALFGLALAGFAVTVFVRDVVGAGLTTRLPGARDIPVWMAWIGMPIATLAGLGLFKENAAYLVRVARGRVPWQGDRPRRRRRG